MIRLLLVVVALGCTACAGPAEPSAPAPPVARASTLPDAAWQHQRLLIRVSLAEWGTDQYAAALAAQVHQESAWRGEARSRFADGWAQFTPATAEWFAESIGKDLGPALPFDAGWALPAMARYMKWIDGRVKHVTERCDHWAMNLSAYNGGPGWVDRDRALCRIADRTDGDCNSNLWWGHVELHSNRAEWAFKENRGYPRRILLTLLPRYLDQGYRGANLCERAP